MEQNKKKHVFTLGSISKNNIIIFLLSPLTFSLNNKISEVYLTTYSDSFKFLSKFFGYIIGALILFFIFTKNNEKSQRKTKGRIYLKKPSLYTKIKSKFILCLILFLISFLDYLSTYLYTFLLKFTEFKFYSPYIIPLEVISFWLLSILIFKLTLYKHHYISMIIISFGLILINFITFKFDDSEKINYFLIGGLLLLQYIFPLLDILSFHLLYKKDFHLYFLLFIIGILSIIFEFIFLFFSDYNLSKLFIEMSNRNNIFIFMLFALSNSITFSLLYSVFKLYKPWIYATTAVINGLISSIFNFHSDNLHYSLNIIIIIIFLFLIFQCLIFNEQIICNFWELNINTQNEIKERAKSDSHTSLIIEEDEDNEQKSEGFISD